MADDRVKQVKQANDIYDVVSSYLALRPAGAAYKGLCPFHEDSRPSFDVDPRRQRYRCWACGKHGDVISFVQEFEKISFLEALELLARRAGITLDTPATASVENRALLLDVMRWAAKQFHECLLDSPLAESARAYLGERGLRGETVRKWGLGFAPGSGHWLVDLAGRAGVSLELLEKVGLVAARTEAEGHYDRFRDRVQFPIRDVRGQVVGFGGRILPTSPLATKAPKYYNSCDTPLFTKSEQLYGIDQARLACEKTGYLAIVEGYTDVLMAHQLGITNVVATMGTALNDRHVKQLRRFVSKVILVFDADAGGEQGVDRALELFAAHDMELSVATLPVGLDPCDLLVRSGAEPFLRILAAAIDALEFKLNGMLSREETSSVEGRKRVAEAVLKVIAPASVLPGETGALKTELIVTRLAQRLALREERLWARLAELRRASRRVRNDPEQIAPIQPASPGAAKAAPEERRLIEILLAEPELVARAYVEIKVEEVMHPGIRRLLAGLYTLYQAGEPATLDRLRLDLQDNPALVNKAFQLQDAGASRPNRLAELAGLLAFFRQRRDRSAKEALKSALHTSPDDQTGMEILRRLQTRTSEIGTDTSTGGEYSSSTSPLV